MGDIQTSLSPIMTRYPVSMGLIKLSDDQRTFSYGTNGRKLMTVPFNEHPYSALAAYFKTDEGMEVLRAVEKQL